MRSLVIMLVMLLPQGCAPSPQAMATPPGTASRSIPPSASTGAPSPAPTPTPFPTIGPLPSDLDPDIRRAIEMRRMYRLRFDLEYVVRVATDPVAYDMLGFPMYEEEGEQLGRDQAEQDRIIRAVHQHPSPPDEYGGLYIDRDLMPGVVVALYTANVGAHDAAIREELGATDLFATRQVKYSEVELRRIQDRISPDMDAPWVLAIPAIFYSVGADIEDNVVDVSVSSAVPDAAEIIAAHYDLGDRIRIVTDGTGGMLIPWGNVVGRVTYRGAPVKIPPSKTVMLGWDLPGDAVGTCGGGDIGFGVDRRGRFELPCQVGRRTILVQVPDVGDGEWRTIGKGRALVKEGKTVRLEIELRERP
jgi:hypothetical protein